MTTEPTVPSAPSRPCPKCGAPMKCQGREWDGMTMAVLLLVFGAVGAGYVHKMGEDQPSLLWLWVPILGLGLVASGSLFCHFVRQCSWECEQCDTWIMTRGKPDWGPSKEPGRCPGCSGVLQPRGSAFMGMAFAYLGIGALGAISSVVLVFNAISSLGAASGGTAGKFVKAGLCVVASAMCVGSAAWRFGSVVHGCPKCGLHVLAPRAERTDATGTG